MDFILRIVIGFDNRFQCRLIRARIPVPEDDLDGIIGISDGRKADQRAQTKQT